MVVARERRRRVPTRMMKIYVRAVRLATSPHEYERESERERERERERECVNGWKTVSHDDGDDDCWWY